MKTPSILPRLQGYRFPREIIAYAVWAYHRFALSTADVEDLLAERGITVSREAVRNWMNRFGCHFADCIKRDRPGAADKWHLDEVVIPINGRRHWLWRAVDANGDVLKDIEQEFAKALGLEDHQRVVGTHINTENFHMHIQFNLVHPETFRMHTPFRDFQVLQLTAAELEKEHGLEVVQGRGPDKDRMHNDQENQKARDKEANSWEQSFSGYLKEHKTDLLAFLRVAETWEELHEGFALYGVELRRRGAGVVFRDIDTGTMEEASAVDRLFSKKNLEDKYGPYRKQDRFF